MMSGYRYYKALYSAAVCCTLLLCSFGCNRGRSMPSTEPVSGTVTVNGKPVGGVEVYFVNEQLVSFGKTDDQGRYRLVQGAVAGDNKIYFNKVETASASGFEGQEGMDEYQLQMAADSGKKPKAGKPAIPPEFSDASNPKLNFIVPDGGTEAADFKL